VPEERSCSQRNHAANCRAGQSENSEAVAEVAAQVVDREEAEGKNAAFVCCREDSADGARDDTDYDVGGAHKHLDSFVER
jgi:hypothetical protein